MSLHLFVLFHHELYLVLHHAAHYCKHHHHKGVYFCPIIPA